MSKSMGEGLYPAMVRSQTNLTDVDVFRNQYMSIRVCPEDSTYGYPVELIYINGKLIIRADADFAEHIEVRPWHSDTLVPEDQS
jgi:hypothetical protein